MEEPETRSEAKSNEVPYLRNAYIIAPSFGSVHWIIYNIPPDAIGLPGGMTTSTSVLPDGTTYGTNEFGGLGYTGPCPPPSVVGLYTVTGGTSEAPRNYYFRVYALDSMLDLAPGSTKADLIKAMDGHMVAHGETMGKFQGPRQQGWFTTGSGSPVPNTPTPSSSQ